MIISRLDYCNSAFVGLPADQVARLQRIQNNAARLVMKKRTRDQVTPLLKELHWLPVKFRYQYKIATLAYRHFEGSLPPYFSSSLCTYEPSRSLRSSKEKLLKIPKRNLKSSSERLILWRRLFGTHYRPISEICQHYLSSNLTSEPSCSPRLFRRSVTPDSRLCICICFV